MVNEKRLIDAYAFYKKFANDIPTITVGEQRYVATWRISDMIADAPTVDAVEVVHGWWIDQSFAMNGGVVRFCTCSECRHEMAFETNYCPNCGAKMDGDG